jgi:hypothetical protein
MILQGEPPNAMGGNLSSLAAASCICSTLIFTYLPDSAVLNSALVVKNREIGGGYCQLTGKWYPRSQLQLDGLGRLVGYDNVTTQPQVWTW